MYKYEDIGHRLADFYPAKKDDIFFIINNFNKYAFGKIRLDEKSLKEAFISCKRVIKIFWKIIFTNVV